MPSHKSARKRVRQNVKRALRNRAARSAGRTTIKKVRIAITSGNKEEAQTALKAAIALLYSSVSKGISHRNTVARTVSRLTLQVNKLG